MQESLPLHLKLDERHAVAGGGILFADTIGHRGRPRVARFRLWRGDREAEVEAYPGDLLTSGGTMFRLEQVVSREAPVQLTTRPGPASPPRATARFGQPLRLPLGQPVHFPSGQELELVAITRFGVTFFFTEKNGVDNFASCDFGFWREDDLLVLIGAADRDGGSVQVTVHEEARVSRRVPATYDQPVALAPEEVACFPEGLSLRLRSAKQTCYGVVHWNLLAQQGDDVSYPLVSLGSPGSPEQQGNFSLLNRQHDLRITREATSPQTRVEVLLHAVTRPTFLFDEVITLPLMESLEGPGGIALRYRGTSHGHGTRMGADGERIPMTVARAHFEVTRGGRSSGFQADLMRNEGRSTHHVLGLRFTVLDVGDVEAQLKVTWAERDGDGEDEAESDQPARPSRSDRGPRRAR